MKLFDTHAHYENGRFDADRDDVLRSLPDKGIEFVANIGSDMETSRQSVALAEQYPFIWAAVGVHPHDAKNFVPENLDELVALLAHPRVRALGEIGLDYHYDFSERSDQKRVFLQQMELARALNVSVVIHEREACADTLDILRQFPTVRGVCHCFSGSIETARELLKLDYMISFTGNITFKNARRAPEVIAWLPEDRIMLETDCPYMAPEPFRGRRCDSGYLYRVCETAAAIRGVSPEHLAEATLQNGRRFYNI